MKKLLLVLLSFLMAFPVFAEDIDLSDMNYEEKLALYEELAEYFDDSFILEPGIYEVGKDIKVGTYRFMYNPGAFAFSYVRIGDAVNVSKTDLEYHRQHFKLYNPFSASYWFQPTEAYYRLKAGDYIVIEVSSVRVEPCEEDLAW